MKESRKNIHCMLLINFDRLFFIFVVKRVILSFFELVQEESKQLRILF